MQHPFGSVYTRRLILIAVLDLACVVLAASVIWVTFRPPLGLLTHTSVALVTGAFLFGALSYCGLYSLATVGRGGATLQGIFASMGLLAAGFGLAYFLVPLPEGRLEVAAHIVALFFPLLLATRCLAHAVLRTSRERVLLIGTSDLGRAIARALGTHEHIGIECVGFLSDRPEDHGARVEGVPVLGPTHMVEKLADRQRIDRVVVASKSRDEHFPADALLWGKLSGLRVESGISFYERVTGRIYMRDLRASYLVFSQGFHMSRAATMAKRALDATAATLGLVLTSPFVAMAAAAIRVDSKGPVFFGQERLGLQGRPFRVWKLRTMRDDAEDGSGAVWACADDARVTRVGRLLRKTRLDEVPQLWNILRGEMSLVGPRPERPEFAPELAETYPYFWYRCAAKPGLTGWAQIREGYAGDSAQWEEKLSLDLYYLKYKSLVLDLLILLDTIKTVVFLRGL